jgi:uncharacterized protein (DUF433 family)
MDRITIDPRVRWGMPCVRGTGTTVAQIVRLQRQGLPPDAILERCPELTAGDVDAALHWHARYGDEGLRPTPPDPGPAHPCISVDPEVQGGYPVIAGTRVTVDAVVGLWEDGFSLEEVLDEFPDLTADDVEDALSYDLDARAEPVTRAPFDGPVSGPVSGPVLGPVDGPGAR